jgi:hypothetical protein
VNLDTRAGLESLDTVDGRAFLVILDGLVSADIRAGRAYLDHLDTQVGLGWEHHRAGQSQQ